MVATISQLVERTRARDVHVVWVQHSDDGLEPKNEAWQIVPDLKPAESERLIEKHYGDSFRGHSARGG